MVKFLFYTKVLLSYSNSERESQLRGQCRIIARSRTRKCSDSSPFCILDFQECDGIANCPKGEDELISRCKDKFSSLATKKCPKKDTHNVNVSTKAVPCDGIQECADGSDEAGCSIEDYVSIICLLFIVFTATLLNNYMKKKTVQNLTPINVNPTLTREEFESGHGSEELSTKMQQLQTCESAKEINKKFALLEADFHSGTISETVLCIKVRKIVFKNHK